MSTCAPRSLARLAPFAAYPPAWHAPLAPRPPPAWHVPPPRRTLTCAVSPSLARLLRYPHLVWPVPHSSSTRALALILRAARPMRVCSPLARHGLPAARPLAQPAPLRSSPSCAARPLRAPCLFSTARSSRHLPARAAHPLAPPAPCAACPLHVPPFPRGTPTSLRVHPSGPPHCPARPPHGQSLSLHVRLAHSRGSPSAPPAACPLAWHAPFGSPPPPRAARPPPPSLASSPLALLAPRAARPPLVLCPLSTARLLTACPLARPAPLRRPPPARLAPSRRSLLARHVSTRPVPPSAARSPVACPSAPLGPLHRPLLARLVRHAFLAPLAWHVPPAACSPRAARLYAACFRCGTSTHMCCLS